MSGLTIFALAIYFITSSDSGSLIVDTLASNGAEEHHWLQRVFWAFTEGAVATGLLVAGGDQSLRALQAASIVFGLPFNFFIFFMCWSVHKMCVVLEEHEDGRNVDEKMLLPKKIWKMPVFGGIFDILEYIVSCGAIHKELGVELPTKQCVVGFVKNLLLPFLSLRSVYDAIDSKDKKKTVNFLTTAAYAILHFTWIALFICGTINHGFVAFGWTAFFLNACILTSLRLDFRGKYGIGGKHIKDKNAQLTFGDSSSSAILHCNSLPLIR